MSTFNLSLSQDPGNTINNAYDLGFIKIPFTITEFIGVTDNTDIYKFSLDKISDLNLLVDGLTDSYLKVDLIYDFNNNGQIDTKDYLKNYYVSEVTIHDDDRYKPIIYRFYNSNLSAHFYTASEVEKNYIQEQLPQYNYEGMSYTAASEIADSLTGVKPVYRFYNTTTGVHLYTMSEVEKNYVINNLTNYRFENIAYHAYETQQENAIPLYRFYHTLADVHFFTPSVGERDYVLENLPWYRLEGNEGVAFYVEQVTEI